MGTREAGFASSLPGYRKFENADDREELAAICGTCRSSGIPTARGLAYPDIIEAALDRQDPRALDHRDQSDRVVSQPRRADAGARDLEFLVVQDGFHPTPTTELADLVLPAAIWGEKEGTYTNSERRVSKVNAAVEPPGEARSDFEIFLDLADGARLPRRAVSRAGRRRRTRSTNGSACRRAGSATTPGMTLRR